MADWEYLFELLGSGAFVAPAPSFSASGAAAIAGAGTFTAPAATIQPFAVAPPSITPGSPPTYGTCVAYGWVTGPWGLVPWIYGVTATPGGPIPTAPPFDLYLVAPCDEMSALLTYTDVNTFTGPDGTSDQFFVHTDQSVVIASGQGYPDDTAWIQIVTSVPATSTTQWTMTMYRLPADFTDVAECHAYVGVTDAAGPCWGLLFSDIGVRYIGAAHHNGTGELVVDSGVLTLPDSIDWIEIGVPWTWKVITDTNVNALFLYADPAEDVVNGSGTLRAILPLFLADSLLTPPTDETIYSASGTVASPTMLSFHSIGLGSGHIAPEYPPIADPGPDQSIQLCQILQLDGTGSYDPEGAPLTYQWRLIDAPATSSFVFEGHDGATLPDAPPTGFTARFYSEELGDEDAVEEIVIGALGDVILQGALALTIVAKGIDGNGYYVDVESAQFVDSLTQVPFRLVRQLSLSNGTTAKPTFYPDVSGIFKFDLRVFDGISYSPRARNLCNVVEAILARGVTPDLSFIWNYLPDSWKLVAETEHIDTFWSAMAQVVASEMFYLWQVDYSKSLRDIQRTVCRKWLHFDTYLAETLPDFTSLSTGLCDVQSVGIPVAGLDVSGLTISVENLITGVVSTITFPAGPNSTAAYLRAVLHNNFGGAGYNVQATANRSPPAATALTYIFIQAAFPFEVTSSAATLFPVLARNSGSFGAGSPKGVSSLLTSRSFEHLDVTGRYVVVAGVGYRIDKVIDDPLDELPFQTLQLRKSLGTINGVTWALATACTSSTIDFVRSLATADDVAELAVNEPDVTDALTVQIPVMGYVPDSPEILLVDPWYTENFLQGRYTAKFVGLYRRTYVPIQPRIKSIPLLQEKVRDAVESEILRHNVDYYLVEERGVPALRFESLTPKDVWEGALPPKQLWAEYVNIDNAEAIEGNFGRLVDFSLDNLAALDNDTDYLSAVRGLWYVHLNGPSLANIRIGTQILLGLPFAEVASKVVEIRNDYGAKQARILLQDLDNQNTIRSYTYPAELSLETNPLTGVPYAVGDEVDVFEPLVRGVEVSDYVSDTNWFNAYVQQGLFFEIEKFFRFLVRVDSPAFSLSSLSFVQTFVRRIKPSYTQPLHVVLRQLGDAEISVTDDVVYSLTLKLHDGTRTRTDDGTPYGGSMWGVATMVDEPDASGGGYRTQVDSSSDPNAVVPGVGENYLTEWGVDRALLFNEHNIIGSMSAEEAVDFTPQVDTIFRVDSQLFIDSPVFFKAAEILWLRGAGITFPQEFTVSGAHTVNRAQIAIKGWTAVSGAGVELSLYVNAVLACTVAFTPPDTGSSSYFDLEVDPPVALSDGDVLTAQVVPVSGINYEVVWRQILVEFGEAIPWAVDMDGILGLDPLPAGTYYSRRIM